MIGALRKSTLGILILLAACTSQPPKADPIVIQGIAVPPMPTLDARSVLKGEQLYAANCEMCHGARLEGEPNWQSPKEDGSLPAPPHDDAGHTWHHPDALLLDIIAHGGDPAFGGTMPGFADKLGEEEMAAVLEFIKSHWNAENREFQWWTSARPN